MDPDQTLRDLREWEATLRTMRGQPDTPAHALRVVQRECDDLRRALDQWIARGGYRPAGY